VLMAFLPEALEYLLRTKEFARHNSRTIESSPRTLQGES
jgi:hypothetical protein